MSDELLLPAIGGLALLDTLSPTTIGVTLVVLLAGRRIVPRTLLYLGTLAGCYLLFGVAVMLGLDVAFDAGRILDDAALGPALLGTGLVLLAVSFVIDPGTKAAKERRKEAAAARAATRREAGDARLRGGATAMVALGFGTFLLEFTTVVPYLAAMGLMTDAALPPTRWVPILAGYNLVMVLPSLGLLVARVTLGGRLEGTFDRWAEQLDAAQRPAAAWVVGAVGVVVALNGASSVFG